MREGCRFSARQCAHIKEAKNRFFLFRWDFSLKKVYVSGNEITWGQKTDSVNKITLGQKLCQAKAFCYFQNFFIPKPTPGGIVSI